VADSVAHERQVAAAIAARGEQIKTGSAEFLWVCCGVRPPLPPPDKPVVIDRNNPPDPKTFEAATRKDSERLQLWSRTKR
jgi:hypothetical protein